ncbi:MAG: aminoacyl-tRNA hydrolase [Planctomycetes bacterium]|nr:aminoacyl-tRNA hydrolase [Planctomycetota bacterium]
MTDVLAVRGAKIPLWAIQVEVSRNSGPGGQNVNKVNSRVTLRLNLRTAPGLSEFSRARLLSKLGPKLTTAGELLVHGAEHRDQSQNKSAAFERLRAMLEQALTPDKRRVATKPTRGSIERKIKARKLRSGIKRERRWRPDAE